jgi:hypothetical protein
MFKTSLTKIFSALAASSLLMVGCAPVDGVEDETEYAEDEKADGVWRPIEEGESPSLLVARASKRLSANLMPSYVGQRFGTPDDRIPYPDSFWPFSDPQNREAQNEAIVNSIDHRWGRHSQSPLERYMTLTNPSKMAEAKAWQQENHGKDVPNVDTWFGLCNGWTAAALLEKPVTKGIDVKLSSGRPVSCTPGSAGCVHFDIGDINGLLAEVYLSGPSEFLGARCDTAPSQVQKDRYGRITQEGCWGTNAGTLLIVANNFMKKRKIGFAVEAQRPDKTDEIWNQPAYAYEITSYEIISEADAAKAVSGGRATSYAEFNPAAKGFARVKATFYWVTENGPNAEYVDGSESTDETNFDMIIELDKAVSDPARPGTANIIGGEYLTGGGTNRLDNFPYLYAPTGSEPDSGGDHNPSIKPSLVKKLAALGR